MSSTVHNPKKIFFRSENDWVNWSALCLLENADKRTTLLVREHEQIEKHRGEKDRFPYCECGKAARFTVRKYKDRKFMLVRMPRTGKHHHDGCASHLETKAGDRARKVPPADHAAGTDFAAVLMNVGDPELREVPQYRSKVSRSRGDNGKDRKRSTRISLRRFGKELLQRSGACEWCPKFVGRRDQRTVNGRICGALKNLHKRPRWGGFLKSVGVVDVVPWSYYNIRVTTNNSVPLGDVVLAFGFLETLSEVNDRGSRIATLSWNPTPVVLAEAVLAEAQRNPESPLQEGLPKFPVWCIFVARKHDGAWKVHKMACFRISKLGAIPVSSNNEEEFVEFLINKQRHFVRHLLQPSGVSIIPDFELLDVSPSCYLEVAGRPKDEVYMKGINRKEEKYGCLVWRTDTSLSKFVLPIRNGLWRRSGFSSSG